MGPEGGSKSSFGLRSLARIRTYFLTGIVVVAPVSLTIYFSWLFISWVDDQVHPPDPGKI